MCRFFEAVAVEAVKRGSKVVSHPVYFEGASQTVLVSGSVKIMNHPASQTFHNKNRWEDQQECLDHKVRHLSTLNQTNRILKVISNIV